MNHLRRPVSLLLALLMMLSVFDSSLSSVFATGIEDSEILSEIEEDTEVVDESLEDSSEEDSYDANEESLVEDSEDEDSEGEDNDDEPTPTFTQLYKDIKELDKIDFSTKQLLVGTNDIAIFTWDTTVLSEYNGVYLLQFNTVDETKSAYTYYLDKADFVDANIVVYAADDSYIGGTSVDDVNMGDDAISILASLSEKDKTGSANIALIDTGADKANESVSVIGSDVKDDNGHGNAMFAAIVSTEEDVSVLSIKALDKNGTGTLASIYAGIEYAVYCGVDVINLSVEAKSTLKSDVLNSALKDAKNAGILVVGSAGNDGSNIEDYLFGDLDNIYVIGASQEDGTTRADSNYGDAVDYSVVAGSTSEAAAKFSALIAVHGIDYVNEILNQGLVYEVGYEPKEDNNIIEASDEEDSEGQAVSSEGNDDSENPEVPEVPENVDEQQEDDESAVIYDDLIEVEPSNNSSLLQRNSLNKVTLGAIDNKLTTKGNGIDPLTQEPVTLDNTTIERITVRWLSKSTGESESAGFGTLSLAPETDTVGNQQFQIDFSLSGQDEHDVGSIELVFPAYIWLNRDGKEPGELTLSVPQDPENGAEFVWKRVGDTIVITNAKKMSAASKVMIQGTFRNVTGHEMVDETVSNDFYATVSVVTPQGNVFSLTSNSIDAKLDTYAVVSEASKTAYNTIKKEYDVWWESIPSDLPNILKPENPDDYAYIRWYVAGTARGNQPYVMTVNDTVEDKYGAIMLGATNTANGTVKSTDGKTIEATLYNGYSETIKSAYIWTAYPKSEMPEGEVVNLSNTQTISVTGHDDHITSTMDASATVKTKVPTTYTFVKIWNDNNDEHEVRPSRLILDIYDDNYSSTTPWRTIYLNSTYAAVDDGTTNKNNWTYSWSDEGKVRSFRVKEWLLDSSGTYDDRFDVVNGKEYHYRWNYILTKTDYNPETHTWEYTNTYDEAWIPFETSNLVKNVEWMYTDSALISSRDNLSLNKLKNNQEVEVKFSVSSKISVAMASVWYGAKPSDIILEDVDYRFNNQNVTIDDVDIGAVILNKPTVYSYGDKNDWQTAEIDGKNLAYYESKVVDTPLTTLYGEKNGEWIAYATIDNKGIVTAIAGSGATVSDSNRVNLPKGVAHVKTQLQTDQAVVSMSYTVCLRVYPTDTIKGMIDTAFEESDNIRLNIYNKANGYAIYRGTKAVNGKYTNGVQVVYRPGERMPDVDLSDVSTGYMHGRQYKVATDLDKSFKMTENDTVNRRIKLHTLATLTQQSNVLLRSDYDQGIELGEIPNTIAGTYYDLLPIGVQPDVSSIKLSGSDRVVAAYTIEDYKGSGRTMLIVRVETDDHITFTTESQIRENPRYKGYSTYPKSGYKNVHTMEFDSYCSWDYLKDVGVDEIERNVIAYEAAEEKIGTLKDWFGEPDDPLARQHLFSANAVGSVAELMTNLDNKRDDPAFVYAGADLEHSEIDVSALTEIQKHVTVDGSGKWSYGTAVYDNGGNFVSGNDVNVQEGGKYTYRISMRSDADTTTKDIIILDSLENYVPNDKDDPLDIKDTRWHGSLVSIDVSQLKAAGADPVIYYSTVPNLDVSREAYNNDLQGGVVADHLKNDKIEGTDEKVWSTTAPEDLSTVTAIAIDVRKDKDGNDFELEEGKALIYYVHMQAPFSKDKNPDYFKGTDGSDHLKNAHAYNAVYLDCLQSTIGKDTQAYINFSYTKVGIYTKNLDVVKVWDDSNDSDGYRPESITVKLKANGQPVYDQDGNERTLTLDKSGNWKGTFERLYTYDEKTGEYLIYTLEEEFDNSSKYILRASRSVKDGIDTATLRNYHEPEKVDIPVEKNWVDDEDNVNGTRPSYITVKLLADGKTTGKTLVIRPDSEGNWKGVFTGLNKYRDHGVEIVYTIQEQAVEDYIDSYEGYVITNRYYPYGDLSIEKRLVDATPQSVEKEFTFTLLLSTSSGEDVIDKYSYSVVNVNDLETVLRTGSVGNGDEFTLKGGEKLIIKDIPSGVTYNVKETKMDGFTVSSSGNVGTIVSGKIKEAVFTNTYSTKGSVQIESKKNLTGHALQRYQFRFDLYDSNGELVKTAYNDVNGNVSFGQITYTTKDNGKEFVYTLKEYDKEKPGYTYDDSVYTVKVVPKDNGDGTITCDVKYYDAEGAEVSSPVFNNSYYAEGEITLRAWKVLESRSLKENEFTFELLDEGSNVIQTKTNAEDGSIVFDPIKFTNADIRSEEDGGSTYNFFIREVAGSDATVNYDESVYGYAITVVDNNDGTLSFAQAGQSVKAVEDTENAELTVKYEVDGESEDLPIFTNTLKDGSLSVTKFTTADEGTTPDSSQEFNFKVKLIGENVEDKSMDYTLSSANDSNVSNGTSNPTPSRMSSPTTAGGLQGKAYAVLTDDGKLIFFRSNGTYGNKATGTFTDIDGNQYTGRVYTRVETASYTSASAVPWYSNRSSIKSVRFAQTVAPKSTAYWFYWCTNLTSIEDLSNLNTSSVTNMSDMFAACSSLPSLDVSKFDTSKVTDMNRMFFYCTGLTELDVSKFDTSNVTNMSDMFGCCSKLMSLNVSKFDTSKVTNMRNMFSNCTGLTELDVSKFDTSKVTNMSDMFSYCSSLPSLDVSGFDTSNVTNMSNMFYYCSKLMSLDLSKFNTSNVTDMNNMFYNCSSLPSLDVSKFNTSNVTNMRNMFYNCSSLTELDVSKFNTSNVTDMSGMFYNCSSLTELDVSKFNTSNVTNMRNMFSSCSSLTSLDVSNFDTSNVTDMYCMFAACSSLPSLDVSKFDTSKVTDMSLMFYNCSSLKYLTVPGGFVKKSKIPKSSYYPTLPSQLTHTLEDDGSVIPINKDTKLTVVKKLTTYVTTPTTYTLKFDAGEASGSMLPQKAESGEDVIINRNAFYKIGYTFCGWKDEKNNKTFELNDNNQAIIPTKTYEAGSTITLSPIWEPINTSVTLKNGEFSFSLHGGEKATFNDIPAGTAYQVYEETPDGWVLIEQSNVSGSIEPLKESKATFTNKYQPGITTVNLVGLKTLDGLAAKEDAEGNAFKFELLENNIVIQTKEVKTGGMIQFDTIEYDKEGSHTYTIREVIGTNDDISYDLHEETVEVVVTDDGKGNLHSDVTYDKDGIVFANTTKPGSLEIRKVGEGITDANKDTVFSFTVKLYNKNGTPVGDEKYTWYDKSTDEELGQSTASNGAILVSAKAGQTIVLKGLKPGMSYEIEETDIPRGWENTVNENTSGTIEANKSSEAVITNKYTATGTATITAHKLLEGSSLETGTFEFELLDSSNEVISTSVNGPVDIVQEIYDDNNKPVTNEWYGTAPVIFDSIKFTEEGDYTFYVREKSGEDTSIVYDTHVETVNIRVFDNGNGSLGTEVEYDSDGALFTNTMKPGQLVVSKTIENATTAASTVDFQFRLTLKDSHGSDLTGTYHVVKSDGSETTITNEGTVSLKGGETFTVTDLPHGCSYEITELDTSGFELTSSVGETGDITGGETSEAFFTNTYSSSGEIVLSASKNLIGGTLTEGMFQFELMDDNNEVIQTVSNNEDGSITFLPIYFTEADDGKEYVYRIKEVTGTTAGIQYDDHTETVIVTVNDTGLGSLDFDVAYDEDGAVFTNSALVDLTISKVVTGSMGNKDEEFTFYLTLSGDEAPETLSYDKDGETGALTVSSGRYEFTLSHGESITFTGIRKGLQYSITEDDSKYNTTISVYESETTSKTVSGTIETSTTVSYTNNLDLRVPTDSTTESRWALIPVFALPVCLLVVGKKRRKQS